MSDHAFRVLCAAIQNLPASTPVTIDLIRDQCDAAHDGYLTGIFLSLPGFDVMHPVQAAVPSRHPAGKGRYVKCWRRTDKPVPDHVCQLSESVAS